jgi:hypothetical protein
MLQGDRGPRSSLLPEMRMTISYSALLNHYQPYSSPVTAEWHVSYLLVQSLIGPWQIHIPLDVRSARRVNDLAIITLSRPYGSGAVQVITLAAVDQGIFNDASGEPFQRVKMSALFQDANGWRDGGAEGLVAQTMVELEGAVAAISGSSGRSWNPVV